MSDWSSSTRGDWGVGLVEERGGVSGRKCKGLGSDGTGVDPSSATKGKHYVQQYYQKGLVMHTRKKGLSVGWGGCGITAPVALRGCGSRVVNAYCTGWVILQN